MTFIRHYLFFFIILIAPFLNAKDGVETTSYTISGQFDLAPYTYLDAAGNPAGYSVEMISEVVREMGAKAKFSLATWSQNIKDLANGKTQIALDISDSPVITKYFSLTLPIAKSHYLIYTQKGAFTNISNLGNKRVVIAKSGRHIIPKLRKAGLNAHIITTTSYKQALIDLSESKNECVIAPAKVANIILHKLSLTNITAVNGISFPFEYRFAVRKSNRELLRALNDGIMRLKLKNSKANSNVVRELKGEVSSNKFKYLSFGVISVFLVNGFIWWFTIFRRKAELKRSIAENKASYSEVFNATSDTLIIFNIDGQVVDVNIRGIELFGYKKKEFIKLNPKKLFHPGHQKKLDIFIKNIQQGEPFHEEVICINKNNSLISVELKGNKLFYNGKPHLLGIIRDITEQKKMDLELIKSKEHAEAAAKAKSDFLANMSHEIRTPLNGVIGLTEILSGTDLTEEQYEYVRDLGYSGEMLRGIINDILDFSKIEAGKLELDPVDFNLYSMLNKLCCTFKYQAELNNVTLNFEYNKSLPKIVHGDSVRIRQVFTNLIGNAIKFTSHGSIKVNVDSKVVAHDHVIYIFEVKDTGIGIPKDKLATLFDKFTQADMSTSRKFGGTGLGLTIAKQLVDKMDGTIYVKSDEGKGTTFSVIMKLPTVKEAHIIEDENVEIKWDRVPKILLAEDNLINQKVAVKFLNELGCEVDVAMNGIAVLDKIKNRSYDLIFMDIQMPDMDGIEATRTIREHEKQDQRTPVIALTAHALKSDHDQYIEAGMDSCITKPISKNKLCITLIKTLSHLLRGVDSKTITKTLRRNSKINRNTRNKNRIFDRELALRLLGGDAEFLDYLLEMFIPQGEAIFSELCSAIDLKELSIVKHTAHSLKGIAAQIGAQRLELAAYNLETSARTEDIEEVKALLELVDKEYSLVKKALLNPDETETLELPLFD